MYITAQYMCQCTFWQLSNKQQRALPPKGEEVTMKSKSLYIFYISILIICIGSNAFAFDASDFDGVKGYTVVDVTHASGTFEGADYDKLIELDNGMVFRFSEYKYFYAYRPYVVVFGKYYDLNEVKQFYPEATTSFTSYKLLINDNFYDVNRVK